VRIVRIALIPKDYVAEPQTVGEHLRKRRKELGLHQWQVAELFGVHRFAILSWEAGRSKPQLKDVPVLIKFLGYDPEPPNLRTIGEHLYAKRRLLGMSYRQLGKHLGFSHDVLMYWEQGRIIRVKEHRKRIAVFIGLPEEKIYESMRERCTNQHKKD
jgi:transcriptional regulator with XRE-family HTH domain